MLDFILSMVYATLVAIALVIIISYRLRELRERKKLGEEGVG